MSNSINHTGIIEKIEGNLVFVKIIQQSACSGCHAKSMCTAAESKDKIIEVPDYTGKFRINENVMICGQSSLGLQAVLLAFVIPILIIVAALALGNYYEWKETINGLCSLLVLAVYYSVLYFLRNKLKKQFVFTLKKLN